MKATLRTGRDYSACCVTPLTHFAHIVTPSPVNAGVGHFRCLGVVVTLQYGTTWYSLEEMLGVPVTILCGSNAIKRLLARRVKQFL